VKLVFHFASLAVFHSWVKTFVAEDAVFVSRCRKVDLVKHLRKAKDVFRVAPFQFLYNGVNDERFSSFQALVVVFNGRRI
jgi:hypothetical protein